MLLSLLLYSFSTGMFSSREIERSTHADVTLRFVCAKGLLEFAALEDVTKLTVLGESIGRKVYKDTIVGLLK